MRVRSISCLIGLLFALTVGCSDKEKPAQSATTQKPKGKRIAIFKIVAHPAIDAMEKGFRAAIAQDAAMAGAELRTYNANGNDANVALYADAIVQEGYDAAFVLGTPCAVKLKEKTKTIPIVLGGATDPVGTRLVESASRPGANITGTTDLPPFGEHLRFLRAVIPTVRTVGVIYNPGEDNSRLAVTALERAATAQQLAIRHIPVHAAAEISPAIAANANSVQALCLPTDNLVHSNMAPALTAAATVRLPAFNCDVSSVRKGALFSVAVEYYDLGTLSAKMVRDILVDGRKPSEMPIQEIRNPLVYINDRVAAGFGVKKPLNWGTPVQSVN